MLLLIIKVLNSHVAPHTDSLQTMSNFAIKVWLREDHSTVSCVSRLSSKGFFGKFTLCTTVSFVEIVAITYLVPIYVGFLIISHISVQ